MPIYTYACLNCEQDVSLLHGSDETEVVCPVCGQESLTKIFNSYTVKDGKSQSVGQVVKKSIEEAKKDLKEQKEEARRDY
jgi:putative FmdB family regulatory protein